jgi:recombinational DNA repair protein (RecF pathway)
MPRFQDPKEAERIMRNAGAIPLEPYTGSQIKWKCKCKKCNAIIFPSLAPVKNRGVSPCQKCAALEMGARRRAKSEKTNVAILKRAHFVPLEDFPGNGKPWRVRCIKCKRECKPHLSSIKNGSSCGYCAGIKLDEADVRKIYKVAGYEPIGKYPGSTRILWRAKHRKCGVTSSPTFASVKKGGGCRTCSGTLRVSPLAAEKLFLKNKLQPLEPYKDTQSPWKSKCLITGKIVSPKYGKVRDFGHRCKYCSENVTDSVDAVALMKKAGFKTLAPFPGGQKPWKSECMKCKKVFSPNFTSVKMGHGCKYCAQKAVDPEDAILAMKKRGFKTLEPFPGAVKPWLVQCITCKREFKSVFRSLNTVNGCKYCSGKAIVETELLERLRELKLKPLEKYQSAKTPWKCKCLVCGHSVQPTWTHIQSGRGHCAYCSQKRVDIPKALKFMKSINLKPLIAFPGTNRPWLSRCLVCMNEVNPRLSDLRRGQGGCSNCADYGLNYQKAGYIYLITHEQKRAHKIGIANSYKSRKFDDRMYQHEKRGWKLYRKLGFKTVKEASEIETRVLKWLRMEVGLPFSLSQKDMPQGGHTETVDASEIELVSIWAKVQELSKVKR